MTTTPADTPDPKLIEDLMLNGYQSDSQHAWLDSLVYPQQPLSPQFIKQTILDHLQEHERLARKQAKQENANDFTAIVESFNRAVKANYDHYSMQNLRFVINNADARAKYNDLPVQITEVATPDTKQGQDNVPTNN